MQSLDVITTTEKCPHSTILQINANGVNVKYHFIIKTLCAFFKPFHVVIISCSNKLAYLYRHNIRLNKSRNISLEEVKYEKLKDITCHNIYLNIFGLFRIFMIAD